METEGQSPLEEQSGAALENEFLSADMLDLPAQPEDDSGDLHT